MTGQSLLQAAVDELYSSPMAEFIARRKALASEARKSGEKESAGQIAALRKPTVSADTLNRLVRAAPDEVGELLDLGADLRAAEKALDGPALRELSTRRRHLVGELADLAFELADQRSPSASVREEVTATLNAALADEQVADRLLSGALITQARWDGFGSTSLPELAAVLPMDAARRTRAPAGRSRSATDIRDRDRDRRSKGSHTSTSEPTLVDESAADATDGSAVGQKPQQADSSATSAKAAPTVETKTAAAVLTASKAKTAAAAAEVEASKAEVEASTAEAQAAEATAAANRARAESEQRRLREAAQVEATEAGEAATSARRALAAVDRRVSELSLQLAHERQTLADAQRTLRSAETRERAAQLALTRAGGAI